MNLTAAALSAASVGPVLPLVLASGRLIPPCSYDRATRIPDRIVSLFDATPHAIGVGVVADASGLLVVDVEHPRKGAGDGPATMRMLQERLGELPWTRTHRTKSGGWHLVFRASYGVRSAQREIRGLEWDAPGVDIVAGHAVLRWPPTSGYVVARDAPIAWLPPAWCRALADKPQPIRAPVEQDESKRSAYADAAMRGVVRDLSAASSLRNPLLSKSAFRLGRMMPPLGEAEVYEALLEACEANGSLKEHGERSCRGTIKRGLLAGQKAPLCLVA